MHASTSRLAVVVAGVALLSGIAGAQGARPTIGVSGGASFPTGDFGKGYDTGYNLSAHVGIRPASFPAGVRVEGMYNRFDLKNTSAARSTIWAGTANLVIGTSSAPGTVRPYLIGGIGAYNSKFETRVANVTVSASGTDLGLNGGAGLDIPLTGIGVFAEARFHYVFTKSGDNNNTSNTGFVPVVVGVRF